MPKSIVYDKFDYGLDLRKGVSTSDANRLRVLKNAYATEGKTIRKRPGTLLIQTLETGTTGLFAGKGKLQTFYTAGTITHANTLFTANKVVHPSVSTNITQVHYADVFNNFVYASIEYANGDIKHHYMDGASPTHIADVNCPNTKQVIKMASKVWSIGVNGDTVRYCAQNAPRNWTLANDAGFLPVGLQQSGSNIATALGFYANKMVVFFSDSSQIWQVDVDPAKNAFLQGVDAGAILSYSHINMAGDVFFLSKGGVRTITIQEQTNNLIDADVGSPIDRELISGQFININNAKGQYYRGGGQYWLYSGTKAMVYTFSRTSGVAAWSLYEYGFNIDYMCELNAELYIRSGNNVYRVDQQTKTDNGTPFNVEVEMAYLDFKAPGMLKQIIAMDAVLTGTCQIAHRYDARNPSLITNPDVTLTGDTRPSNLFPVELMATNIAPVIKNNDAGDFELHQLIYYFNQLPPL